MTINLPDYLTQEQAHVSLARRAWSHFYIPNFLRDRRTCYDTLLALCTDDVVWTHEGPDDPAVPTYPGEVIGRDALRNLLASEDIGLVDANDLEDPMTRPLEFLVRGNRVVMLLEERYLIRKSCITVRNNHVAVVMDFRDFMIERIRLIGNMSDFIEAFLGRGWSTRTPVSE